MSNIYQAAENPNNPATCEQNFKLNAFLVLLLRLVVPAAKNWGKKTGLNDHVKPDVGLEPTAVRLRVVRSTELS